MKKHQSHITCLFAVILIYPFFLNYKALDKKEEDPKTSVLDWAKQDVSKKDFSNLPVKKIETLILDSCNLLRLDEGILLFKNLERISLRYNPNLDLVQAIRVLKQLPKLKFLNQSNNLLEKIPDSIAHLHHLTTLRLSHNRLNRDNSFIPLLELKKLRRLWVDNNRIKNFPKELLLSSRLRFLYAYDNEMNRIQLPKEQTKKLWVLHLGTNHFEELPEQLMEIKNLRMVMMNRNRIKYISPEFSSKKYSMSALILDCNPINAQDKKRADKMFKRFMLYSSKINDCE